MKRLLRMLMFASLGLMALAWWRQDALPDPSWLLSHIADEPLQTPTQRTTFQTTVGSIEYTVKPVYDYELYGLVVSKHNADSWWDYIHAEANDKLNITDLCVVWGDNALQGHYQGISFSSGQFTCNYQTASSEVWSHFNEAQISNNHLLTDNPRLAKLLRNVHIGDQIHFRGVLAEYSHHHGFAYHRGTSTVRTDTGNGACETVFLAEAEIIKAGHKLWRNLLWSCMALFIACLAMTLRMPYRADD